MLEGPGDIRLCLPPALLPCLIPQMIEFAMVNISVGGSSGRIKINVSMQTSSTLLVGVNITYLIPFSFETQLQYFVLDSLGAEV